MEKDIKLYWKLYEEYYTNEDILRNFRNLIDVYHPQKKGKIIDIGCGQSQYLIDFYKNSEHELYAIDDESIQIEALKRRLKKITSNSEITFSNKKFDYLNFSEEVFSGVIISNLLHFMALEEAKSFINDVENIIEKDTLILLTNHSWKHSSNGDFNYFKHYYRKQDFYNLLPRNKHEYLYIDRKSESKGAKSIEFLKKWLKLVANHQNVFDESRISKFQSDYLKKSEKNENITIVVRRK